MPNRVIRDGFLDSDKVNRLDWFAECVYHRLLLVVDDAGRIDGRTDLLVSRLFPLKGRVRANDVESALHELKEAGLIVSWKVDGQPVVQVTNWRRCGRSQYSRYPDVEGNFAIQYVERETRDGKVWFVSTSLPRGPTPSAPHADPMPTPSAPHNGQRHTKTKTGTKTKTTTTTTTETKTGCDGRAPPGVVEVVVAKDFWSKERLETANHVGRVIGLKSKTARRLALVIAALVAKGVLPRHLVEEALEATRKCAKHDRVLYLRGYLAQALAQSNGQTDRQTAYALWGSLADEVRPVVEDYLAQAERRKARKGGG